MKLSDTVFNRDTGVLDGLEKEDPKYDEYEKEFQRIDGVGGDDRNGGIYGGGKNAAAISQAIKEMKRLKGDIKSYKAGIKGLEKDIIKEVQNRPEVQAMAGKERKKKESQLIESEVKNYVKSKVGSFEYFTSRIAEFANKYKGKNEFIPLEYMREIYGAKGALMMICNLENGNIIKRKFFSTYRRVCERILKEYRSLKVEAALIAVKSGYLETSSLDVKDINELNTLLYKLTVLEDEAALKKDWRSGLLRNSPYLKNKFEIDPNSKVFSFGEYMAKAEELIPRLKSIEGKKNKERKQLINKFVKEIRKVKEKELKTSEELLGRTEYLQKYNTFIERSSRLALHYLQKEGARKIARFNIKDTGGTVIEIGAKRDYGIDTCKIALMCLVAVCSKNEACINQGLKWFRMNEPFLKKCIG